MDPQEKESRNREIATMIGAIHSIHAEAWGFGNAKNIGSKMFHGVMYKDVIEAQRFEKELKFHSDWNWLMEAIEFIESLRMDVPGYFVVDYYVVNAGRNYCNISSGLKHADGETVSPHFYEKSAHGEDRITSVFIAVSDFAKHYNSKQI